MLDLDHLDARYAKATPGPWVPYTHASGSEVIANGEIPCVPLSAHHKPDAEWAAALHNAYPALRERIRELEALSDARFEDNETLRSNLKVHREKYSEACTDILTRDARIRDLEAEVAHLRKVSGT